MENIKLTVKDRKLLIECDLDVAGTPSNSRKTTILACTRGKEEIEPGVILNLNLYKYPSA